MTRHIMLQLLMLAALAMPAAARMRRPWESEEDYAYNTKHGIMSRTPPEGWNRPGGAKGDVLFPGLTDEARAHCTKNGHQCDKAERSAACLLAQNGYLGHIDAFKAEGYLTAQDLVDADFTCGCPIAAPSLLRCSCARCAVAARLHRQLCSAAPHIIDVASREDHLKELGMTQLIHRKKFVGKVLHYAKKVAADVQKDEL